jgi:hypothetical protein
MHDLLEGVCIYDMSLILYYYIIETKQQSIEGFSTAFPSNPA